MKIELNTEAKTIKILEDVSTMELLELLNTIKDIEQYKVIQTEVVKHHYYPHYQYYHTSPWINPYVYSTGSPTITVGSSGRTITTSNGGGTNSFYRFNQD